MLDSPAPSLRFPHAAPPEPGQWRPVAPGVLWFRLALPYALDHVNAYVVADGAGWAVLDTGVDDARTRAAWSALIAEALGGAPITRVIATHFHPDHMGLAGWLAERDAAPLLTSRTEYLMSSVIRATGGFSDRADVRGFYRAGGLDAAATDSLLERGHAYLTHTSPLPPRFHRLASGDRITLGDRSLEV